MLTRRIWLSLSVIASVNLLLTGCASAKSSQFSNEIPLTLVNGDLSKGCSLPSPNAIPEAKKFISQLYQIQKGWTSKQVKEVLGNRPTRNGDWLTQVASREDGDVLDKWVIFFKEGLWQKYKDVSFMDAEVIFFGDEDGTPVVRGVYFELSKGEYSPSEKKCEWDLLEK